MAVPDPWLARRHVGGDLVSEVVRESRAARLELLKRRTPGVMSWEFEQPTLALFWFANGYHRSKLRIAGESVESAMFSKASIGLVAPNTDILGDFETDAHCDYAVAFIDTGWIPSRARIEHSAMTFLDMRLGSSFSELAAAARRDDSLFDLMLDGWALQTLARLGSNVTSAVPAPAAVSLPPASLRKAVDYVRSNYGGRITVSDLAEAAGYSSRHFTRAFTAVTGSTPMKFVTQVRIAEAMRLLADGKHDVTDVALICGFSHAQHFATVFRSTVGSTPTQYARSV